MPRPELYPVKKVVGFDRDMMDTIEKWRAEQKPIPNVSDAIRRLVERGLKVKTPARPIGKPGSRARAQELAAGTIEKIVDPSAPPEERAQRRRRLTKGPEEFREVRVDRPKAKGK